MPIDYDDQAEINRIATNFVEKALITQDWEMFKITPDYRIDYDIEPRKDKSLTGHRVAVQQKGKQHVDLSADSATCGDLKVDHVCYWVDLHQRPVFLFLIDVSAEKGWWLFLQQYIIENSANLGQIKGNWRNQKTMTVHVPLNQTLENFPMLERAIAESYQYMARLHPTSISDAINAQIAKLKSVDPDVEVTVQITNDNGVVFILSATNPERPFALAFNPKGERIEQLQQDIIEKGLAVRHEPGEILFYGSLIFETDWFVNMRGVQIANVSHNDVYLIIERTDGPPAAEIKFPNAKLEAGTSELRIDGRIWEALATISGIIAKDSTIQKMSFRIDLSKWMGYRVSELRYFSQIFAFVKATLKGQIVSIYIEHLDERHLVGSAPALKETSRQQWESMAAVLQFIDNLRLLEKRLNLRLCVPEIFDREEFVLVGEMLRVTDYTSFAAPEWTARTDLENVPEETVQQMKSGQVQLAGTTVLKKQAQQVQLLGQTIIVPAHSYTTTHVVPQLVAMSAVKSLFGFAARIGYLRFDVARPLRLAALRDRLAERILSEVEVQRMLAMERHPRNHALLYMLYASGMRVSECCGLKWRDLQERAEAGQVTIFGKGGKNNTILLPASVWSMVGSLRGEAADDAAVFRSRKGKHLHATQVRRIVLMAAKRAGIEKAVSPHWLRHGHASHALDRGAPIHLVQQTLGHASISTTGRYLHARPTESSSNYLPI